MLCEFTLPSNPAVMVRLHEATVQDAIDFSGIDPDFEEEAASLFLERVQEKETYSDPRDWTGEDRRFALFQYYVSTTTYKDIPLTYTCSACGEQHTTDIALADILAGYTPISGKAFREFVHEGHNVVVHPLTGRDLENLERFRFDLMRTEQAAEAAGLSAEDARHLAGEVRVKRTRMAMYRFIACVDLPFLDEKGTPASRHGLVENYLKEMSASDFKEFVGKVEDGLVEMRHGLQTTYVDGRILLEIPNVACDNNPSEVVTLRYPFRFGSVIPTI